MKTIQIGEDIKTALHEISYTCGPVRIELFVDTGNGNFFNLVAIANALQNHKYPTKAVIRGCASLIPAAGADVVEIEPGSCAYVKPLTVLASGNIEEMEKTREMLVKCTNVMRGLYSRWPEVQKLVDDGDEHFIDADVAVKLGITLPRYFDFKETTNYLM